MRMQVPSLASFIGLRIRHCCELWCRSHTWLRPCIAEAVAQAGSCSSNSTPSLGTPICHRRGPKDTHTHKHTHTRMHTHKGTTIWPCGHTHTHTKVPLSDLVDTHTHTHTQRYHYLTLWCPAGIYILETAFTSGITSETITWTLM